MIVAVTETQGFVRRQMLQITQARSREEFLEAGRCLMIGSFGRLK